jgi:hypothetical protein
LPAATWTPEVSSLPKRHSALRAASFATGGRRDVPLIFLRSIAQRCVIVESMIQVARSMGSCTAMKPVLGDGPLPRPNGFQSPARLRSQVVRVRSAATWASIMRLPVSCQTTTACEGAMRSKLPRRRIVSVAERSCAHSCDRQEIRISEIPPRTPIRTSTP